MAVAIQVAGLATIRVNTGNGGTYETLGYTRAGAEIRERAHWVNVPGDQYGGEEGPPVDVQFLGEIHHVRTELTKWDPDVFAKCPRLKGQTPGVPVAAGTLVCADARYVKLLIATTTGSSREYQRAFIRDEIEVNVGTKFSTLIIVWECHTDPTTGKMWQPYGTTTTTAAP